MTDIQREKELIETYVQGALSSGFFTSLSTTRTFNAETFEYDVLRYNEQVAVAVTSLSDSGRPNEASIYTNKELTVPVYKEKTTIPAWSKFARDPGQNPFESSSTQGKISRRAAESFVLMQEKISRSVELQHAQMLQGGVITLTDKAGGTIYTVDFKLKTTHDVTVTTTWAGGAGDPTGDLESICDQVRKDGRSRVEKLVFGRLALQYFLADSEVRALLDNRRMFLGSVERPRVEDNGGVYHGTISIGTHNVEIWSYEDDYEDPATGDLTPYLAPTKVVVLAKSVDIISAFGDVPILAQPEGRVLRYLPDRIASPGMQFTPMAWIEKDGQSLTAQVTSRPLAVPKSIDRIGVLTVVP
jgi:hypothetical protein